jgi:TolA-binding protein
MRGVRIAVVGWALAAVVFAAPDATALAQNQQQIQMNADLRMLMEIAQRLQKSVNELAGAVKDLQDQVKAVNGRIDVQGTQISSAAATEKTLIDSLATSLGALEQKVRDNSMNTQRLTDEMDAIRKGLGMLTELITNLAQGQPPAAASSTSPAGTPDLASASASPGQAFQDAYGFYSRGDYPTARDAFKEFIAKFPTSPDAANAQFDIGMSYWNEAGAATSPTVKTAKYNDAIAAFTEVVTKYKDCGCEAEPDAYYQRGLSYNNLKIVPKAREDFLKIQAEYARTKSPVWQNANDLAGYMLKSIGK